MKLANKVALITGGTQGIGRGIALRFIQEGADVVIAGRARHEKAIETARTLSEQSNGRVHLATGDISEVSSCRELVSETIATMGRLDIVVNNAGVEKAASFWDITEEHYDRTMSVNLKGAFFITQAFARYVKEQQDQGATAGGRVINTSSVHEELPFPNFTSYCASKGGLKMLMRNLAIELAPLGITVNNIAPGAIETPMNSHLLNSPQLLNALLNNIPLKRLGQPADVAGVAAFLASDDASYVTGSSYYVDGGLLWNYTEQ